MARSLAEPEQSLGERVGLYQRAQDEWGSEAQVAKAAEEFSELAAALNRLQNDQQSLDELYAEIADAQLMLEQLHLEFDTWELERALTDAVDDLDERVGGDDGE